MEHTGMIRALLKASLITKLVHTAILLAIWAFRQPILHITTSWAVEGTNETGFLPLMLMPLISLGVYILLFFLLKTHLDANTPPANAGILLGAAIGVPILLHAFSFVFDLFRNLLISRIYGVTDLRMISAISSYMNFFSFLSTFTMLSTAAAAGMLYWRAKHTDPQSFPAS